MKDDERQSVIAQFRVTPDVRGQLEAAAKIAEKKLSDWLRDRSLPVV